jgi:hypothetical protein
MQTGHARHPGGIARWWERRQAERRAIALAALDMHERYGAAAYGIARNSALRGAGAQRRRFWRRVARRLRRGPGRSGARWRIAALAGTGRGVRAALRLFARA